MGNSDSEFIDKFLLISNVDVFLSFLDGIEINRLYNLFSPSKYNKVFDK